ncbi:MAG: hypothetical protein M3463_21780, partial [Verrucomicrobiota bacterium]|nr:hypothetical protein [Verrucomicrobiota bacterium]
AWEPYAVWLRDTWLKPLFAEAKIVAGVGDPEQWASLLSPAAFQALKDRVDVDFSPANPPFHAPGEDVDVDLIIKNVPKLIVKIYEINTLSFFLSQNRQLNTDLQLDGLIANRETTYNLADEQAGRSPFRRVPRTFKFPELKGKRGAWMIEFIGGDRSSRALIRSGPWSLLQQTGPAGEMLTVLDEARQPVPNAVVWLEGRRFTPDEQSGRILVPFTREPGPKPIILADAAGEFATLTQIRHSAERYFLDAHFHVEREQLLARREASLVVRPALRLGGALVPLDLLEETRLIITSTTLDGVSTTSEVNALKLDPARIFAHTITVPERLAQLTVTLSGKVKNLSAGGEENELSAKRTWQLNGIDKTAATNDGYLSRFGNRYVFELLGKNGESLPDQQVLFRFTHRDFSKEEIIPLRTDEKGRIHLGELKDIWKVGAKLPNGRTRTWGLRDSERAWPESIHAKAGELVRVPWNYDAAPRDGDVSLLETRAGAFVRDLRNAVSLLNGFLEIKGLAPGDYSLSARGAWHAVTIRVTEGKPVQNWLVSDNRHLEVRDPAPLGIRSVTAEGNALVVQLGNANRFTRVHVAATRFVPEQGIFASFGRFWRRNPGLVIPAKLPSLWAAGREIGDEYRYILERRYAKIFPGNMLTRPGLLLNPWEVRSTDVLPIDTKSGQAAGATAGGRAPAAAMPPEFVSRVAGDPAAEDEDSNFDFLAAAAPVLYNLMPDENGVVRVDRKALGDRQHVQVYAEDLTSAAWRTVALDEAPTKFQDLRLARNLDPQKPFTEKKQVTALNAGQALTLADILTSELESYD